MFFSIRKRKFLFVNAVAVFLFLTSISAFSAQSFSIGVSMQEADSGVLIAEVAGNSPADQGGLLDNDVVLQIADKKINNSNDLSESVKNSMGETLPFWIERNSSIKVLYIKPKPVELSSYNLSTNNYNKGIAAEEKKHYVRAKYFYKKAALQGHAVAQINLGNLYEGGQGGTKDYKEAKKWYEKSAAQGNATAQNNLGILYTHGRGVTKDHKEAREWYEKSAAQGHATAQNNLGFLYQNGWGVTKDDKKAREWYEKSAAQGYAQAQNDLGTFYHYGWGVNTNLVKAKALYGRAAAKGHAQAQNNLGNLYYYHWGDTKNYWEAKKWYEKSAAQGYAKAQNNLGNLYEQGQGVTKNYWEAKKWYEKSAAQGNATAQYNLGTLYERGWGVTKDDKKAREWYEKSAARGYKRDYHDYISEILYYAKEKFMPSLGSAIVVLLFISLLYFLYKFFRNPSKRFIDGVTDNIEKRRQDKLTTDELIRKRHSSEEEARVKAHNFIDQSFEKTIQSITDEKALKVIDQLKQQAEEKILSMQLENIEKISKEHEKTMNEIKKAKHLSPFEKATLSKEIRELLEKV